MKYNALLWSPVILQHLANYSSTLASSESVFKIQMSLLNKLQRMNIQMHLYIEILTISSPKLGTSTSFY